MALMSDEIQICLIDNLNRRRVEAGRWLLQCGFKITPMASVKELKPERIGDAIMLIGDEPGQLLSLVELMNAHGKQAPILCYSPDPAPQRVVDAVFEGADGYLPWPFGQSELLASLQSASALLDEMKNARLRAKRSADRLAILTDREKEVLILVALGCKNKEIGETLSISPRTAEIHRYNSRKKIGARTNIDLLRIFYDAGIL